MKWRGDLYEGVEGGYVLCSEKYLPSLRIFHTANINFAGLCCRPQTIVPAKHIYSLDIVTSKNSFAVILEEFGTHKNFHYNYDDLLPPLPRPQIADGLRYLHSLYIVHRDVKPSNVLVWSLHPEKGIDVKLTDYGISQFSSPSGLRRHRGTEEYMAPELFRSRNYDEKVCEGVGWGVREWCMRV